MMHTAAVALGFVAALAVQSAAASSFPPREPSSLGTGDLVLDLSGVKIVRLPEGSTSIVLASPTVATIQPGTSGELLVTGRALGSTPYLLQDAQGRIVGEGLIRVETPPAFLVLNNGPEKTTYVCRPICHPATPDAPKAAP